MYLLKGRSIKIFFFLSVFLLSVLSLARPESDVQADRIVAIVNDMIITQSEVQEYVNFAYFQLSARLKGERLQERINQVAGEALTRLVEDKLILQQALKEEIKIQDIEIAAGIEEMKSRFGSEKNFEEAMRKQNTSPSDLKKGLREQALMRAIIERKVKPKIYVSPQEITKFYNEHPEEFKLQEGRDVSLIAFDDEEKAKHVLGQINQGKDISEFFKQSLSYQTSQDIRKGKFDADAQNQIFSLAPGTYSGVINNDDRFYILKILAVLPPKEISLSQAQYSIHEILFEEKMAKELTAWLDELKNKAYVVIK